MKRSIFKTIASLSAAAMMLLAVGCGSTSDSSSAAGTNSTAAATGEDNSLQKVLDSGKLVLGLDPTFKPMGYTDENDNIVGFDIDVAKEVCSRLGVELETYSVNWDTKEQDLNAGTIDCIWNGLSVSDERKKVMLMSEPYMKNEMVFVVNGSSDVASQADLAGKNVLVQADSSALAALQDEENTDIKALADSFGSLTQVPDYESALMELEAGSADAVAMDEGVALTKQAQNDNIVILDDVISQEQYGIAFKKGNDELRDQVWSTLVEMEKDGTVDKIAAKYPSINTANICISDNE